MSSTMIPKGKKRSLPKEMEEKPFKALWASFKIQRSCSGLREEQKELPIGKCQSETRLPMPNSRRPRRQRLQYRTSDQRKCWKAQRSKSRSAHWSRRPQKGKCFLSILHLHQLLSWEWIGTRLRTNSWRFDSKCVLQKKNPMWNIESLLTRKSAKGEDGGRCDGMRLGGTRDRERVWFLFRIDGRAEAHGAQRSSSGRQCTGIRSWLFILKRGSSNKEAV